MDIYPRHFSPLCNTMYGVPFIDSDFINSAFHSYKRQAGSTNN